MIHYIAITPKGVSAICNSITDLLDLQSLQKYPFYRFDKPRQVNPRPSRGTTQRLKDMFEMRTAFSKRDKPLFAVYGHNDPKRLSLLDVSMFTSTKAERLARKKHAKKKKRKA